MTYEAPPRLKHGDEFGPLLQAADVTVSPERIATNAAGYKALIAAGATTALWKLIVPFVLLAALIVPVVLLTRDEPTASPITSASPEHAAISDEHAAMHATSTVPETAPALPIEEPKPIVKSVPAPAPTIVEAPPPPAVPAPSELPEQIRLYEEARDAVRRGEYGVAVARVDDLLLRFPSTPLKAEAQLTRAESLARANRVADASKALEALIADDAHRGRRGELLRTLADLYRRNNDCARAVDAYNRALAQRLSDRDRKEVIRGRDHCAKQ